MNLNTAEVGVGRNVHCEGRPCTDHLERVTDQTAAQRQRARKATYSGHVTSPVWV